MIDNIFLAIESHLAAPSKQSSDRIKDLSHKLGEIAFEQAKKAYPNKDKISGDDFMPFLKENILDQARLAFNVSARLIKNTTKVTEEDPEFIFRLSEDQKKSVLNIQTELLSSNSKRRPDGLIFAYVGFIERRKSAFSYCTQLEASIRDHNILLRLKANDLRSRGYHAAANILSNTNKSIKELCKDYPQTNAEHSQFISTLNALLIRAKESPELKENLPVSEFIRNFLLVISVVGLGYLAGTARERGTFWYQPNADTKNQLERFVNTSQTQEPTDLLDDDSCSSFEQERSKSAPF